MLIGTVSVFIPYILDNRWSWLRGQLFFLIFNWFGISDVVSIIISVFAWFEFSTDDSSFILDDSFRQHVVRIVVLVFGLQIVIFLILLEFSIYSVLKRFFLGLFYAVLIKVFFGLVNIVLSGVFLRLIQGVFIDVLHRLVYIVLSRVFLGLVNIF
jgi:hypothetical protein